MMQKLGPTVCLYCRRELSKTLTIVLKVVVGSRTSEAQTTRQRSKAAWLVARQEPCLSGFVQTETDDPFRAFIGVAHHCG